MALAFNSRTYTTDLANMNAIREKQFSFKIIGRQKYFSENKIIQRDKFLEGK